MRLFKCQNCSQLIYFENSHCERCRKTLGYLPEQFELSALEPAGGELWHPMVAPDRGFRFCDNAKQDACNWLIPADSSERMCQACRHNRTIPDLSDPERLAHWRQLEVAKHRLIYALMRLHLPLKNRADDPKNGLVFDILADEQTPDAQPVMTGHEDGLITIALSEADDAEREKRRAAMHEPYRTLLGHFRHEVGHYYWDRLVDDRGLLSECRAVFGDDEADYGEALQQHYKEGAPPDWQDHYVSTYATTHAWEDFAETWAHYLHIIDSLDTASAFGIEVHPGLTRDPAMHVELAQDPYGAGNFDQLVQAWLPLTYAMNGMNRSMGLPDMYPFILSADVIKKLSFIHRLVHLQPAELRQAA